MLEVSALSKAFVAEGGRTVNAMRDVSFSLAKGEMFTLLGPSGCGKTTTLRSVAGLEIPDGGEIIVNGRTVYSSRSGIQIPSSQRGIGMVFQSYAIWPHMTVWENVAFPLLVPSRRRLYSKKKVNDAVERVLAVVDLSGYEHRKATQLSGGQQQRLALARAIIIEPPLLLLDEPLSNLDAKLRDRMAIELKRLQEELDITCVYVTHDQSEALALSHKIAVVNNGQIVQMGTPRDIYERPNDNFVAEFVGTSNFLTGSILEVDRARGMALVSTPCGKIWISCPDAINVGSVITVSIRPEYFDISAEQGVGDDAWRAQVEALIFYGFYQTAILRIGEEKLMARVPSTARYAQGSTVAVKIRPEHCVVCR